MVEDFGVWYGEIVNYVYGVGCVVDGVFVVFGFVGVVGGFRCDEGVCLVVLVGDGYVCLVWF